MNLLLDFGNTRLKWCLYPQGQSLENAQMGACASVDACALAQTWRNLPIKQVLLASVAGPMATTALAATLSQFGFAVQFIRSQAQFAGLTCAYARAADLGVDRWLGMLGAHLAHPHQNCLIVSAGTAFTIDAVAAGGTHLGGYIAPGLSMMRAALAQGGALLPQLDPAADTATAIDFASDTHSAIAAGTLAALVQLICHSVLQLQNQHNLVKIIFSGGNGEQILNALPAEYRHNSRLEPHLVFNALAYIGAQS